MKDKILFFFSVFFLPSLGYGGTQIFIEYAAVFDSQCGPVFKMNITPDQVKEAYETLPDLQRAWNVDGPALMAKAQEIILKAYPRKELTLSTTLCGFVPMASPLLVNIRPYLKSTAGKLPIKSFVQLAFHEWIHLYLESFYNFQSPFFEKYREEKFNVKAHLHLMALEKAVYVALNRDDFIQSADHVYRDVIKDDYLKSWEIIEKEGYEPFLKELRGK